MLLTKCQTKANRLFYLFNGLFYIEHVIFCAPIIMLKMSVDQRNYELHGHFSLIPEVNIHCLRMYIMVTSLF